jgi:hypothetical protein
MANQNLSQFTEKTFVADADHTFIWDTVGAISKRVSRNSWLNSGTLTSDAPVTISQTWNNAAVAFTGLKVNAAGTSGTNSAAASLLADFQVGGVSQASVNKSGNLTVVGDLRANGGNSFLSGTTLRIGNSNGDINLSGGSLIVPLTTAFGWANTLLVRDGFDNTLALRNGAAAQTFNVYGTYTSGTSYERLSFSAPTAANAIIGTNKGSGGGTARGLDLHTDGAARMTITTAGNVGIGTTSPTSKLHVAGDVTLPSGGSIFFGGGYNIYGSTTATTINGPTAFGQVQVAVNGTTKWVFNYDGLLCGGGTTAAFPAIKRSSTTLQARLADDSAFASIQGKLTTDTAYTATVVAATGYITIYDSTGTAYRVPCAL